MLVNNKNIKISWHKAQISWHSPKKTHNFPPQSTARSFFLRKVYSWIGEISGNPKKRMHKTHSESEKSSNLVI